MTPLVRRSLAEALGTGALVTAVVGSGIAAERLSPGDAGLQLLENALATAAALFVLVLVLAPVSGAHLNPVVTLAARVERSIDSHRAGAYVAAQVGGACAGAALANLMFDLSPITLSETSRGGSHRWLAEVVATAGLLLVVTGLSRSGRAHAIAAAVAVYIGAAYFFTSSTSFANPAVTVGRTLTDTFAGIAPASAPMFVVAQLAGAALGLGLARVLFPVVVTADVE